MSGAPPPEGVDQAWPSEPGYRHDAAGPHDAFPVPFSVVESFGAVVWTLAAMVLVRSVAVAIGIEFGPDPVSVLVVISAQLFTLAGLVAYLRARGRLSWRLLGPVRPRRRHVAVGVGIGTAGFVIVQLTVAVAAQLFGPVEAPQQSLLEAGRIGGVTAVLAAVAAVAIAPVVEEVVFRGLLFQSLRRRTGLAAALVISGIVFAVVHLELDQAVFGVALLLLAVWFAGAFHRTGTLVVAVVGHATFNAINLALALVLRTP